MKETCPRCQKEFKILKRCNICNKFICSQCVRFGTCMDCFLSIKGNKEINTYFKEKYEA